MRSCVVCFVLLAASAGLFGDPPDEPTADRVARLIKQLGHEEFARREEASKELDAIGEQVFDALQKAATSDGDAEIRSRAQRILDTFTARAQAAAAKKELAAWEGVWVGNGGQKLIFKGDRYLWGDATVKPDATPTNPLAIVEVGKMVTVAELVVGEGTPAQKVCHAIFRRDGDTLHYCGTYGDSRPTEFKPTEENTYYAWKRVTKRPI